MPGAAPRAAAAARGSVSKRATTLRSLPIDATAGRRSISKAERTPPGQGAARLRVLLSGAAAADEARAALTRACDEAQLRVLLRSAKGREVRATLADLAESSRQERQAADARAELRRGGRPPGWLGCGPLLRALLRVSMHAHAHARTPIRQLIRTRA